jgi:predicted nuclease of predicted toxin-antitoxin system
MPVRFHLDEHVDDAIASALRRRGIDVTTTMDAGLQSATDLQHIAFAREQRRVIHTNDPDFLAHAAAGVPHAGIVFCRAGTRSMGQIIEHLLLMDACMSVDEIIDHIEFI